MCALFNSKVKTHEFFKMSHLTTITGRVIILPEDDVDTDRIIPARFLKCVTFDDLGNHVFANDRAQAREKGTFHPFDDPQFRGASILFTGSNFGSGSSREHAVQALMKWGIKAVVAYGKYSEIFFSNALANGLPAVLLAQPDWQALVARLKKDAHREVVINLEKMMVADVYHCTFQQYFARNALLSGEWDMLGILLEAGDEIEKALQRLPQK